MKSYNQAIISSYLTYLDVNNLYGLAICMKLPYGNLKWGNDIKTTDDVLKYILYLVIRNHIILLIRYVLKAIKYFQLQ